MSAEPILTVSGLRKGFAVRNAGFSLPFAGSVKKVQALDGVSLSVERGETLGIVGESGCGKSTLARCLVRLIEPDEGQIELDGLDTLKLGGAARRAFSRRVQMVFQDPYGSLNPRIPVGEALAEVLRFHKIVQPAAIGARVADLLDLVHLPRDAALRYPHEFSGGQRQRIGIARALAVEPAIIIADEPVSALDVSVQAQIINLFLELQQRLALTLVFISHDLRLVRHISHRVAVMYLGKIVEIGEADAVFNAPRHPYTRVLVEAVPQVVPGRRSERAAVQGELPSPIDPPPGCSFHPRCPIAEARCRIEVPAPAPRGGPWPVACHLVGV